LHAGCFDVRTGAGQADPITEDLAVYPVRREGGCIFVKMSGKPA
jgi:nitrite reductase/ring-hydroxylating ferredoxin subunit